MMWLFLKHKSRVIKTKQSTTIGRWRASDALGQEQADFSCKGSEKKRFGVFQGYVHICCTLSFIFIGFASAVL